MKRPLPLDTRRFAEATSGLTLRELGAMVRLAMWFWRHGELPVSEIEIGHVVGVRGARLATVLPAVLPFFASGAMLPILREAHLTKVGRRAKIARASTATRMARRKKPMRTG